MFMHTIGYICMLARIEIIRISKQQQKQKHQQYLRSTRPKSWLFSVVLSVGPAFRLFATNSSFIQGERTHIAICFRWSSK